MNERSLPMIYLAAAIVLEVAGTTCMKLSEGFTRWVPAALMGICYIACFGMLTLALKKFDVSVTYAIWAGAGTALISAVGVIWFKEPVSFLKIVSVLLIIAGVVGLNLAGKAHG